MVQFRLIDNNDAHITSGGLLDDGEVIIVVDDSPEIVLLLSHRLSSLDFPVRGCHSADELFALLTREKAALVLLDINLPDQNGAELLKALVERDPDLGIVMVTASTDLQMALACMRAGADDYLTKPLSPELLAKATIATLTKRKLVIENRRFQHTLEQHAGERQLLYRLGQAMNNAYLTFYELDGILHAILVGITAREGLGFNRAFLALFAPDGSLRGRMAIGPANPEEASRVWNDIAAKALSFDDIIYNYQSGVGDAATNKIVRQMVIAADMHDHVVMVAGREKRSIAIINGQGKNGVNAYDLPVMLGCGDFLVTPLIAPRGPIGVIIADNSITGAAIGDNDIRRLEVLASQASLAIERSRLHQEMLEKIAELEEVTQELAKSRDQIVEMERYSTIGHMTGQLAHDIRNPLASIGAAAAWLERKCNDPRYGQFLDIIVKETGRIESALTSMSAFASDSGLSLVRQPLAPLIEEALLALRPELRAAAIVSQFMPPSDGVFVNVDAAKMREVFLLLIKNSILAMPAGGFLRVEIGHGDGQTVVTFSHPGQSMAESNIQDQATEPFHGGPSYKRALGLTMARQIVSRHGGKVLFTSPQGSGNVIRVILPET